MELTAIYDSPIGPITLTSDGEALVGLRFSEPAKDRVSPLNTKHSPLNTSIRWLDLYFSGISPDFLPPIFLRGTPFQHRVWQALTEIPYGHTTTYGELARRIGCRSAQAVGQAIGKNPIAIIVPCHRVVGSDGTLTGYAHGIEKKQYLLELEKQSLIP
jgi:methylated-DNA-[protein]-cysteine S-methyltransferase